MRKILFFVLSLLSVFALPSFGDGNTPPKRDVGQTVFYFVIVILFALGLIVISRWGKKIKERDEEFEKERADFLKKQEEDAENETDSTESDEEKLEDAEETEDEDVGESE